MKTSPKVTVDTMPADKFFAYAAELLKLHPPHITDQPIIARMKRIGIEPGKSFDLAKADPVARKALESAPAAAQKLMAWKVPTLARVVNNWSMNTDTMGVYGNYYLKRAIIAQIGLGANLPEDAIYPFNIGDEAGRPLDGASKYTINFDKDATPPVNAFWSITLYDPDGFQVANSLNRFAVSSWMPFKPNPDGSLTLYFQNESPGADKEANWLPAPKGAFNLTMRLYGPKSEALTGAWAPPASAARRRDHGRAMTTARARRRPWTAAPDEARPCPRHLRDLLLGFLALSGVAIVVLHRHAARASSPTSAASLCDRGDDRRWVGLPPSCAMGSP